MTNDSINSYSYDAAGRLRTAATGGYGYNGLGQRVQKVVTPLVAGLPAPSLSTATLFAYDEAGHLIGEYDGSGNLIQETVWLDDLPMVVLKPEGNFYIHADHLNTPRQIDNAVQQAVWVWDTITFGASSPNENPSGIGVPFKYNPRHAGQYYDGETGLFQNGHRDYNSNLGRYIESDPIGLAGGLNTYGYAEQNPLIKTDPTGEAAAVLSAPITLPSLGEFCFAGPAGAVTCGAAGGFAAGTLIYPHIEPALSQAIDSVCEDEDEDFCEQRYQIELATCRALGRAERARRVPPGSRLVIHLLKRANGLA